MYIILLRVNLVNGNKICQNVGETSIFISLFITVSRVYKELKTGLLVMKTKLNFDHNQSNRPVSIVKSYSLQYMHSVKHYY